VREIADTASVMGIPEAELTPKVRQAIITLMGEVEDLRHQVEHARSRLKELEDLADQDAVLPLYNRRAFVRELNRVFSFVQRYSMPACLVYFDINGLKAINDRLGHAAGDAALHQVACLLRANIRESDVVGRLGGDEFGVVLVQVDEASGREKAESLAAALAHHPLEWQGTTVPLGAAYGVYPLTLGLHEDPQKALAAADRAMYLHKKSLQAGEKKVEFVSDKAAPAAAAAIISH
jgi:diguanylate cyclase (GGDEF)-like protein